MVEFLPWSGNNKALDSSNVLMCPFFIRPSHSLPALVHRILGLTQLPDPQPLLCPLLRFSPHHFAQHLPKFIHPPACCAFPAICLSIAHLLPYGCFPPPISGSCRSLRNISPTFFLVAFFSVPFLHHSHHFLSPPCSLSRSPGLYCSTADPHSPNLLRANHPPFLSSAYTP